MGWQDDRMLTFLNTGASEINISCVIEEKDADRAINILHTSLFTFLD
jgi:aspartate kinase